jgi:hypothetical protein
MFYQFFFNYLFFSNKFVYLSIVSAIDEPGPSRRTKKDACIDPMRSDSIKASTDVSVRATGRASDIDNM